MRPPPYTPPQIVSLLMLFLNIISRLAAACGHRLPLVPKGLRQVADEKENCFANSAPIAIGLWFVLCSVVIAAEPPITALAFAPKGDVVLAASQSGLKELSWPSLQVERAVETQAVNLHDLSFSPNGEMLAVAGGAPADNGSVVVFAWPHYKRIAVLDQHDDSVMSVVWDTDSFVVSASLDHTVSLWEVKSGNQTATLRGHSRGVTSVCFAGKTRNLISGGIDQSLRVWHEDRPELVRSLANHTKRVTDLASRPGEHALPMVASSSEDRTVRFWQPTIGRLVRFIRLDAIPLAIEWFPDGEQIAASCDDGSVYVIDPESVTVTAQIKLTDGWAYCLAIHPSGENAAVGCSDGSVRRIEF